jgi:hypothetical protein
VPWYGVLGIVLGWLFVAFLLALLVGSFLGRTKE